MPKASVSKVSGEFYKKGRCEVCGKMCERSRTIASSSYDDMLRQGEVWSALPIVHKKCELLMDVEEPRPVETTSPL